ncbi:MAG: L,D-transpeptidase family protein, partial [Candidatus Binatia bacterium]
PPEKITRAEVQLPARGELPGLFGWPQRARTRKGQTLLDVARAAGLGFQELQDANPTLDPWLPQPGAEIAVPTTWILPRSGYRGIVINIPEMRLYLFPPDTRPGDAVVVRTFAIGIGTEKQPSPVGAFTVRSKDENPTWYPPVSIQKTMEVPRAVVPPGPDNPLGDYRIRLSRGLYAIHGTNTPWSIGRLTTHGCIRLYPEDIEELYVLVEPKMAGELVYQPVKIGAFGETIYAEIHADVYGKIRDLEGHALAEARRVGVLGRVDREKLRAAARERRGVPVDVTRRTAPGVTLSRGESGPYLRANAGQ